MRRTASEMLHELQVRVARLERQAGRVQDSAWLSAKYSVGGSRPQTGRRILAENEGDEDVRLALIEAYNTGSFRGFNMEDIDLVSRR